MSEKSTDPWKVRGSDFPVEQVPSVRLEFLVRYAVLAPSTHNSQPWLFRVRGDALELFADRTRSLPLCDPNGRELTISCGAALQFARLAARAFGREGAVELMPDAGNPDLLARLCLGAPHPPTSAEVRRFQAIPNRHTTRKPFTTDPLVDQHVAELSTLAGKHGVAITLTSDPAIRDEVAALVAQADRRLMADPAFRRELSKWVRPKAASGAGGMSLSSFGLSDRLSAAASAAIRIFNLRAETAFKFRRLTRQSPWLGLLSSPEDDERSWLQTGMALSDIVLELAASNIACSYLDQPVEVPDLRPQLARIMGVEELPQMLLRIGRGTAVPSAVRREPRLVIGT
jgi:hypothetical protein